MNMVMNRPGAGLLRPLLKGSSHHKHLTGSWWGVGGHEALPLAGRSRPQVSDPPPRPLTPRPPALLFSNPTPAHTSGSQSLSTHTGIQAHLNLLPANPRLVFRQTSLHLSFPGSTRLSQKASPTTGTKC